MPGIRAEISGQTAESICVNSPPRGKARRPPERAGSALSEDKNSKERHSHESTADSRKLVRNGLENVLMGPPGPRGSGWLYRVGGPGEKPGTEPRDADPYFKVLWTPKSPTG